MTTITQKQLDDYKTLYPDDKRLQELSLSELLENTDGGTVDWNSIEFPPDSESDGTMEDDIVAISDCQMAIGYVVFDAVCLAVGGVGLRKSVNARTIRSISAAVAPVLNKLEIVIAEIRAAKSIRGKALGVFKILQVIYNGGCLGTVFSAFTGGLTITEKALYTISGAATIVAFVATDGVAFVAEIVVLLATFGFLASDVAKAVHACQTAIPTPNPDGTRIRDDSTGTFYLVLDGALRSFPDMPTYESLYGKSPVDKHLPNVHDYLIGTRIAPQGTSLITSDPVTDYKVYLLLEEGKRWIPSPTIFSRYNFDASKIRKIPSDELSQIPVGIALV